MEEGRKWVRLLVACGWHHGDERISISGRSVAQAIHTIHPSSASSASDCHSPGGPVTEPCL